MKIRSKVRVYHERRWHDGTIIGVSNLPNQQHEYCVSLERPFGKPETVFNKKESEIQLISEPVTVPCMRVSEMNSADLGRLPCNDNASAA